jgi:hypothetical protein
MGGIMNIATAVFQEHFWLFVNKVSFANSEKSWESMEATGHMDVDEDGGEALLGEGGALQAGGMACLPGVSDEAMVSFGDFALAAKQPVGKKEPKLGKKNGSEIRSGNAGCNSTIFGPGMRHGSSPSLENALS